MAVSSVGHGVVWLGMTLKFPTFIVKNSKQRINFNSVTNVSFWEPASNFGIFKHASRNSPQHLWFKKRCNENLLKIGKN